MIEELKMSLPIFITLPRKTMKDKRVSLNLNTYRNLQHFTNNAIKREFSKIVTAQLDTKIMKLKPPYRVRYTFYAPNKRRCDLSNICSIVDKFFCDAITKAGLWEDDNTDFITEIEYLFGGIDKDNPRVDVSVIQANKTNIAL